ncbi:SIS domain-containing protein [Marinicrinis lubricantis]|uniref:SIS domain-containing protein n=1 Tax=Marinicrinis lubricantis TaxID=2086470 RepID=A0ABW1IJ80_9BACL
MTQTAGKLTYSEIAGQSEALSAAWRELENQQDWIRRYIGNEEFDEVVFIGSGSSYYQALTMASSYRKWMGRRASAHPSSEIFLFREQAVGSGGNMLLVGVSRSGESTEVILAMEAVQNDPSWTLCGITCCEDSRMAKLAPCLVSPLGREESTVMTKSFSSMTFMMQGAIAYASAQGSGRAQAGVMEGLQQCMQRSGDVVNGADAFAKQIVNHMTFSKYMYLGMGAYQGLSLEASLKIKEMSCVWTESFGTLEFRHGPKSIVEPGTFVCLLLSQQARSYELKVAEEMKGYGAYTVIICAEPGEDTAFADQVFDLRSPDVEDEARAVLYLPVLQYLGYYTALSKKLNPDYPRHLTQVVKI